jgi:putative membrane protein
MAAHVETKAQDPSTELAAVRTELAAERTLMAWIRTSLGMISFGFTIYKFMHALAVTHEKSPRRLGIVLAALGTMSLAAGTIQYAHALRMAGRRWPGLTFYVACMVVAIGVLVLVGIIVRMGPLS